MILFLSRAMRRASSTLTNRVYSTFTDPDALGGIIGGPITIVYMTGSAAAIVAASLTYGMVGILSSLLLVPLASSWLAHGTVMGIAAGNKTFVDTVTGVIRAAWTLMVVACATMVRWATGGIRAALVRMVVAPIQAPIEAPIGSPARRQIDDDVDEFVSPTRNQARLNYNETVLGQNVDDSMVNN